MFWRQTKSFAFRNSANSLNRFSEVMSQFQNCIFEKKLRVRSLIKGTSKRYGMGDVEVSCHFIGPKTYGGVPLFQNFKTLATSFEKDFILS